MQLRKTILFLLLFVKLVHGKREAINIRTKKALLFPASSTLGIFIAIAVPLELPNRNVFMSYNFEANYNLPWEGEHYIPGPLKRFQFEEFEEERREKRETTRNYEKENGYHQDLPNNPIIKSLLSRTHIYRILEDKLQSLGYEGKSCLLRLICDINSSDFGNINGILGDIFHIIFSSKFSRNEDLHPDYLKAENNGANLNCPDYSKYCPHNLLDLISVPVKFVHNRF